jgi:predicted component of type VI protein secretion system
MPRLHILSGIMEGKVIELAEDRITIGRALDNMIRLADGTISHHHAVFGLDGENYKLRDLNSTNGTRVNGLRSAEVLLRDGDQVRMGSVEMRYESAAKKASQPLPPMTTGVDMSQVGAGGPPPASFAGAGAQHRKMLAGSGMLKWAVVGLGIIAVGVLAFFVWKFMQVR